MSIPIIATLALLAGLAYWNDWLNGLYYISDDRLFSIQVLLNRMLLDVQFLMSNSDAAKSRSKMRSLCCPPQVFGWQWLLWVRCLFWWYILSFKNTL